MDGTRSTLLGLKKMLNDFTKAQIWAWPLLHAEAVASGQVNESRSMLVSNRGPYGIMRMWAEFHLLFHLMKL